MLFPPPVNGFNVMTDQCIPYITLNSFNVHKHGQTLDGQNEEEDNTQRWTLLNLKLIQNWSNRWCVCGSGMRQGFWHFCMLLLSAVSASPLTVAEGQGGSGGSGLHNDD